MSRLTCLLACIGLLSSIQALNLVSATSNVTVTASTNVTVTASTNVTVTPSTNVSVTVHPSTPSSSLAINVTASKINNTAAPVISTGAKAVTKAIRITPTPSKSFTSVKTSTTHVSPTTTPSPPPSPPPCLFTIVYNYTDPHTKKPTNRTCFRMQGCFALNFTYNATKGNTTEMLNITADYYNENASMCNNESALIIFNWTESSNEFHLQFNFTAENNKKGSKGWHYNNLTMNYVIKNETTFSDFVNITKLFNKNVTAYLNQSLFEETNGFVEFERSYRCNSKLFIPFADNLNVTAFSFNTTLVTSNLRVQAFQFRVPGEFGSNRYCVFDSSGGSKIVPIAVGAALGALVIIILCAYLISQFVARKKKTTYETLN